MVILYIGVHITLVVGEPLQNLDCNVVIVCIVNSIPHTHTQRERERDGCLANDLCTAVWINILFKSL